MGHTRRAVLANPGGDQHLACLFGGVPIYMVNTRRTPIHAATSCLQICLAPPFNARGSQLQKCLLTLGSCAQQPPRLKKE